jgi:hypothetical protein
MFSYVSTSAISLLTSIGRVSGDAHRIESRVQCKDIIPLAVFDMKDNSVDMNLEVRMTHPMVRNPHSICTIRSKLQLPDKGS